LKKEQRNELVVSVLAFLCACILIDVGSTFFLFYFVMKKRPRERMVRPPSPIKPGEYWNENNIEEKITITEPTLPCIPNATAHETNIQIIASAPTLEDIDATVTMPVLERQIPPMPPESSDWLDRMKPRVNVIEYDDDDESSDDEETACEEEIIQAPSLRNAHSSCSSH
jgi:hypothetical protein